MKKNKNKKLKNARLHVLKLGLCALCKNFTAHLPRSCGQLLQRFILLVVFKSFKMSMISSMGDITKCVAFLKQQEKGIRDEWWPTGEANFKTIDCGEFRVKQNVFWTVHNMSNLVASNTTKVECHGTGELLTKKKPAGVWCELRLRQDLPETTTVDEFERQINECFKILNSHIGRNSTTATLDYKFKLVRSNAQKSNLLHHILQYKTTGPIESKHIFLKIGQVLRSAVPPTTTRDDKLATGKYYVVRVTGTNTPILSFQTNFKTATTAQLKRMYLVQNPDPAPGLAVLAHEQQQRFLLLFQRAIEQQRIFVEHLESGNLQEINQSLVRTQTILRACAQFVVGNQQIEKTLKNADKLIQDLQPFVLAAGGGYAAAGGKSAALGDVDPEDGDVDIEGFDDEESGGGFGAAAVVLGKRKVGNDLKFSPKHLNDLFSNIKF